MSEKLFLAAIVTILVYLGAEARLPVRPLIRFQSFSDSSPSPVIPYMAHAPRVQVGP